MQFAVREQKLIFALRQQTEAIYGIALFLKNDK